jgi:hypothetical protein
MWNSGYGRWVLFWIKLDYKNIMFFSFDNPTLVFFEMGEVQLILQLKN